MIILIFCICVYIILLVIVRQQLNNKYCNSNYNRCKDSLDIVLDKPKYTVIKIEQTYCKNNTAKIAKYTLRNYFITKKDNIDCQELIVYDVIGKYNIGDVLTFIVYNG